MSADIQGSVASSDILSGYRTDHNIVTITLKKPNLSKRGLCWKFNNSLLSDEKYISMIKKEIKNIKEQYMLPVYSALALNSDRDIQFVIDDQLFFETLMCHLRGVTIQYGSRKKKAQGRHERKLIESIQHFDSLASQDKGVINVLERTKEELYMIRKEKMKGVLVRAKARWIEEGERPTKYFCGLEKRQYSQKYMGCVEINGEIEHDQEVIMNYLKDFFKEVYGHRTRQKTLDEFTPFLCDNFPKLSDEERSAMEGRLTLGEASSAVSKLRNDKSPGPDGFSANFFKCFWEDLGFLLVRSLNAGFAEGMLTVTQRQGVITLVPKPGKPKQVINSWRPISLLNTTQKILSTAIADRFKLFLIN